jgi:hypothetical protein
MVAFIRHFLPRAVIAAACLLTSPAFAADYTDVWFSPQESGWGVNVVQSDSFLFLTFFIYAADQQPTWYTASLTFDGTRYAGGLYHTVGTYWPNPWNAGDHPAAQQVGTASFEPDGNNAYQATLTYAVDGIGSVTKRIERQSLTQIALGGSYVGAQAGAYGGCPASANNGPYTDTYSLAISQAVAGTATLSFSYDSGAGCTLSGNLQQNGQLYQMSGASYVCTGNLNFNATATVYELKATAQGVEGRLVANLPSGCLESANFSAVLK